MTLWNATTIVQLDVLSLGSQPKYNHGAQRGKQYILLRLVDTYKKSAVEFVEKPNSENITSVIKKCSRRDNHLH